MSLSFEQFCNVPDLATFSTESDNSGQRLRSDEGGLSALTRSGHAVRGAKRPAFDPTRTLGEVRLAPIVLRNPSAAASDLNVFDLDQCA